jgi:protein TIF31
MKQSVDQTICNGHVDDRTATRRDSDNDDSITNTSSTSSSSSNLNTNEIATVTSNNDNASTELVVLPEISFNVRVQAAGLDIFDLPVRDERTNERTNDILRCLSIDCQVTSSELVQEIHQVLMDKEETCHRTCFSLQVDGTILDNFTELKNIDGLKEGSLLKVVEGESLFTFDIDTIWCLLPCFVEQYTVREVRMHVRHINELIHSCDPFDLYNGTNGYSLSIVNDITNSDASTLMHVGQ